MECFSLDGIKMTFRELAKTIDNMSDIEKDAAVVVCDADDDFHHMCTVIGIGATHKYIENQTGEEDDALLPFIVFSRKLQNLFEN